MMTRDVLVVQASTFKFSCFYVNIYIFPLYQKLQKDKIKDEKKVKTKNVNFLKSDPKPALSKSDYTTGCSRPPRSSHSGLHEIW
jgi:hypothetical protein